MLVCLRPPLEQNGGVKLCHNCYHVNCVQQSDIHDYLISKQRNKETPPESFWQLMPNRNVCELYLSPHSYSVSNLVLLCITPHVQNGHEVSSCILGTSSYNWTGCKTHFSKKSFSYFLFFFFYVWLLSSPVHENFICTTLKRITNNTGTLDFMPQLTVSSLPLFHVAACMPTEKWKWRHNEAQFLEPWST